VLDVRERQPFGFVALTGSVNVPLRELPAWLASEEARRAGEAAPRAAPAAFVLCRRGVDSLVAVRLLREAGWDAVNVEGGLRAIAACEGGGAGEDEAVHGRAATDTAGWSLRDVWY